MKKLSYIYHIIKKHTMKKIISITVFAFILLIGKSYAQSNITWVIKDKIEKGFFKTATTINSQFNGFSNKEDADKFIQKIKGNAEVASVSILNSDVNGNTDMKITMKQTHDKQYYIGMAQKLGVQYIEANGKKKTPAQYIEEMRAKKK